MQVIKIIESKHWINKVSGHTASIYGSVPYTNEADKLNWSIELRGYTWQLSNGTIGLGRQPAKTLAEAQAVMNLINAMGKK
jgi:hypothetical protein